MGNNHCAAQLQWVAALWVRKFGHNFVMECRSLMR